jgi:SPP1 gp7 family putative phage head morphogenesis protein
MIRKVVPTLRSMEVHRRFDRAARLKAHQAVSASKRAEARYVLDILAVMGAVYRAVLKVVEREHLAPEPLHEDAARVGLGPQFVSRLMKWQSPEVEKAFDRMAGEVNKSSAAGHKELLGIDPRHVTGVPSVIEHARVSNVRLITNASEAFLAQVRQVLEENEGQSVETIRKALQERVGVSRSRATLIARDQTLKLNAQISQHRQRAAGLKKYTWSGSLDEREREGHLRLEGRVCSWDDPPDTTDKEDGTDHNHPGEDIQCRCAAIPYVEELAGEDEPDEDQPEGEGEEEAEEAGETAAAEELGSAPEEDDPAAELEGGEEIDPEEAEEIEGEGALDWLPGETPAAALARRRRKAGR